MPNPDPITAHVILNPEAIEAIAQRAAEIVLARMPAPTTDSEYLTVLEAAELMRCKRQRIYDLLYEGRLTRFADGSRALIQREEVEAHLRGEDTGPTGEAGRRARARSAA